MRVLESERQIGNYCLRTWSPFATATLVVDVSQFEQIPELVSKRSSFLHSSIGIILLFGTLKSFGTVQEYSTQRHKIYVLFMCVCVCVRQIKLNFDTVSLCLVQKFMNF